MVSVSLKKQLLALLSFTLGFLTFCLILCFLLLFLDFSSFLGSMCIGFSIFFPI